MQRGRTVSTPSYCVPPVHSYDEPIYESRFFLPSTDHGKWSTGTSKKLFSLLSSPASAQYQAVNAANRPSQRVSTPLSITDS